MSGHLVEHGNTMMADDKKSDSEFTIFNKLPSEIRQMIWKATFRGRAVKITLECLYLAGKHGNRKQREKVVFHNSAPYPPTMFVNCESRITTLLYYTKPCPSNPGNPILFHPKLDSVMVAFSSENDSECSYNWDGQKRVACWDCPALMQTLRTLFLPCLELFQMYVRQSGDLIQEFLECYDVFSFRNLEHLIIFGDGKEVVPFDGRRRVDYEGVKLLFEKGFRKRNLKDKKHKIPKIIFYHGQIDLLPGFQDELNTLLGLDH
ncbi:81bf206e-289a-4a25-bf32-e387764898b6-CDS [Sclerotinia trifoliorum]|uniref:81bf206e-289a-4a25-bf32-e387764898b6-CDS n=1 Tax=Sclerotinia trifoliorum TaxID=28548 RepID=A0A8H2VUU8_9HELO|nr:81bf206e-289a-4a25-bf32-e387764898b6-CDS [Sclerotinia trifoliorum]